MLFSFITCISEDIYFFRKAKTDEGREKEKKRKKPKNIPVVKMLSYFLNSFLIDYLSNHFHFLGTELENIRIYIHHGGYEGRMCLTYKINVV